MATSYIYVYEGGERTPLYRARAQRAAELLAARLQEAGVGGWRAVWRVALSALAEGREVRVGGLIFSPRPPA